MNSRSSRHTRRKPSTREAEMLAADRAREEFAAAVARLVAERKLLRDVSGQSELEMLEYATALTTEE